MTVSDFVFLRSGCSVAFQRLYFDLELCHGMFKEKESDVPLCRVPDSIDSIRSNTAVREQEQEFPKLRICFRVPEDIYIRVRIRITDVFICFRRNITYTFDIDTDINKNQYPGIGLRVTIKTRENGNDIVRGRKDSFLRYFII